MQTVRESDIYKAGSQYPVL